MSSTNFKAIGIEKEMTELFNSLEASEFTLLNESSYFDNPYISKRQPNSCFCDIIVTDCQSDNWWYRKLIGMKFTCLIVFLNCRLTKRKYIYSVHGVRATNTKVIKFRSFDIKDVSII